VRLEAGKTILAETGAAWRVTNAKPDAKWLTAEFDDAKWAPATVVAQYGAQPWGNVLGGAKKAGGGKRTPSGTVAAAEDLILQPGFKAELLYNVPKPEQGSWVSLAVAPNGDLVAGDQGGVHLARLAQGSRQAGRHQDRHQGDRLPRPALRPRRALRLHERAGQGRHLAPA